MTNLHVVCDVAGGLEGDGHAGDAAAVAAAVAELEGVVDGAEEHPRELGGGNSIGPFFTLY